MDDVDLFRDPHANAELAATELRNPAAIRARCGQLLARARRGDSAWFALDEAALPPIAERVARQARRDHPALTRPRLLLPVLPGAGLHGISLPWVSFWRHLEAGGVDRRQQLEAQLAPLPPGERAHARIDLAVAGVLLAAAGGALGLADAGPSCGSWHYQETATGLRLGGAEGLAVASFHAFTGGLFSGRADRPCQADSLGLRALPRDRLAQVLQISPVNPLPRLESRVVALRRLGERLAEAAPVFGAEGRPGALFDHLETPFGLGLPHTADLQAADLLAQLLVSLPGLGAQTSAMGDTALGDCWRHPAVRGPGASDGWVPLHGPLQWLAGSLVEPFAWSGVHVDGLEALTAPSDAWHANFLVSTGVLRPRVSLAAFRPDQALGDEVAVEWRAITVSLLEALASQVRKQLALSDRQLPMPVLQGLWRGLE